MRLSNKILAAGVALAVGMGSAGQASAYIYAGSRLLVDDLNINFAPFDGSGVVISQFDFFTTATASAVGASDTSKANCTGDLTGGGTTCGDGTAADPVLYPGLSGTTTDGSGTADAGIVRTPRTMTYLGPVAGGDWASSDAVVERAQLVDAANGTPITGTEANQISEANLQTTTAADADTNISSTTLLTYSFTANAAGNLLINLRAEVGTYAEFLTSGDIPPVVGATASANTTFSITLTGTDGFIWKPTFTTVAGCGGLSVANLQLSGGTTCVNEETSESLQLTSAAFALPDSVSQTSRSLVYSPLALAVNIGSGSYSLSIKASTDATTTRRVAIPEPSTLLLLGIGMGGLGFAKIRRKRRDS